MDRLVRTNLHTHFVVVRYLPIALRRLWPRPPSGKPSHERSMPSKVQLRHSVGLRPRSAARPMLPGVIIVLVEPRCRRLSSVGIVSTILRNRSSSDDTEQTDRRISENVHPDSSLLSSEVTEPPHFRLTSECPISRTSSVQSAAERRRCQER